MDKTNYNTILSLTSNEEEKQKVKLISKEIPKNDLEDIPDPYYGENDGFELVYNLLDKACEGIIKNYTLK